MSRSTLICLLALIARFVAAQDGLLLYAPFDGAPDAVIAVGNAGNTASEQSYTEGVAGQAVVVDTDCQFSSVGNFNQSEGTVAMWYRPHWGADAPGAHYAFCMYGQRDLPESWAINRWNLDFSGGQWHYTIFSREPGKTLSLNARPQPWTEGVWRHLAFTWRNVNSGRPDAEMKLYIDGRLAGELSGKQVDVGPSNEIMSVGRDQDATPDYAEADVDELFVYARALTAEEIAAGVQRAQAGAPALQSVELQARQVPGWWNAQWPYRVTAKVSAEETPRADLFVQCPLRAAEGVAGLGVPGRVIPASVRVVEHGSVIPSRFTEGLLEWQAPGVTAAGQVRNFDIYFRVSRYEILAPLQAVAVGLDVEPGPEPPPAPDYATAAFGKPWDFEDGTLSGIDQWGNKPEYIQNRKVENGILSMDVAQDPWFIWGDMWGQVTEANRKISIDLDAYPVLEMKVRQSVQSAPWELYGRAGASTNLMHHEFTVSGSGWQRIRIDLKRDARWAGVLSAFRIDPTTETKAHVEIDWVRLIKASVVNHGAVETIGAPDGEPARIALSVPQTRVPAGSTQVIAATVTGRDGKPVCGQPVSIELAEGSGGRLSFCADARSLEVTPGLRRALTDADGTARVSYIASERAQKTADTLLARVEFAEPLQARETVDTIPGPAHHYRVEPAKVVALREAELPLAISAQLVDEFGNPVSGARQITWSTDAPGQLSEAAPTLDGTGKAVAKWSGDEARRWVYTVRVEDPLGLKGESAAICLLRSSPREDPIVLDESGYFRKGPDGPAWLPLGGFYANWVGVTRDGEEGRQLLSFVDATEQQTEDWLAFLASQGVTSLRFMLRAHTPRGMEPMDVIGRVNMPLFAKVLRYMDLARKHDIRFMLTIHEDYTKPAYHNRQAFETFCLPHFQDEDLDALPPHQRRFIRDRKLIGPIEQKYTDPDVMACQDQYCRELVGLLKDNPQLFSWEFENEMVDCPASWANHAAAVIRQADPVTPICASHGGGGLHTADPLWWTTETDIDFYTYHIYPNTTTTSPEIDYGASIDVLTCYGRMAGVCMLGESAGDEWSRYPREGDDDRRYAMRDIIWFSIVNGNPGCYFWNARGFEVAQFRLAKQITDRIDWTGWSRQRPQVAVVIDHPLTDDKYYRTPQGLKDYAVMGRYAQHYLSAGIDFDFAMSPQGYAQASDLSAFAPVEAPAYLAPGEGWQVRATARDGLGEGLAYVRNMARIRNWRLDEGNPRVNLWLRERAEAPLRLTLNLPAARVLITATDLDTGEERVLEAEGKGIVDLGASGHDWAVHWRSGE